MNDIFRYITEELRSITAQYTSNKEAAELLRILGSSNTAPSDTTIQDARRDAKGGKKRHKRWPQWVTTVAD
jgi:hypothetical protein